MKLYPIQEVASLETDSNTIVSVFFDNRQATFLLLF